MTELRLLIFDDHTGQFGPMTDRRAIFELRTGIHLNLSRISSTLGVKPKMLWTAREEMVQVLQERYDLPVNEVPAGPGDWLLVSGGWSSIEAAEQVQALATGAAVVQADGALVAARLTAADAQAYLAAGDLPDHVKRQEVTQRALATRPWHILDDVDAVLRADLAASTLPEADRDAWQARGVSIVGDHAVRIAPTATLLPMTVIDARTGPVAIDHDAELSAFASLQGPCYVGVHSTLAAHTSIRPWSIIGPHCKVGGELSAAIIYGQSNKAHAGYLGNSLVGEWCNLGADTNVSNLKNTYGQVRIQLELDSKPQDTGRTTHGPIVGDFVRTAIGSRLLTGSVLGTGSMLAASDFAPKHLPRFSFQTDAGSQLHDIERLIETARQMMLRRQTMLSSSEEALLRDLHRSHTQQPV